MEAIRIEEVVKAVEGTLLYGATDTAITSVCIHSKEIQQGALFVPIVGERVDAHRFMDEVFEAGAIAVFTSKHKSREELGEIKENGIYIAVENTIEALQKLGAYYRSRFSYPVIGITGSVGKTTTKEMVSVALESKKNVMKTIGNKNSQIGLPLMMFSLEKEYEIAVIEMGMSEPGEMSRLAAVAKPEVAIMTNIGVSHISQFGSKENIRKEKLNIINECFNNETSVLFVNGDDILLKELKVYQKEKKQGIKKDYPFSDKSLEKLENIRILTYGIQTECDYYAEDVVTKNGKTYFTYCSPKGKERVVLSVLGIHNVANVIVALAIAEYYEIDPSIAKVGLQEYKPIAMRGQIHQKNDFKIIDDTYNASPDSMKSAINVLLSLEEMEYRIAVLADIMELGEVSYQSHYEVGEYIAQAENKDVFVNEVITIGTEAKAIAQGVRKKNERILTHSFDTNKEVITYLKEMKQPNKAVLVKGSRGMHTDEIVKALLEE